MRFWLKKKKKGLTEKKQRIDRENRQKLQIDVYLDDFFRLRERSLPDLSVSMAFHSCFMSVLDLRLRLLARKVLLEVLEPAADGGLDNSTGGTLPIDTSVAFAACSSACFLPISHAITLLDSAPAVGRDNFGLLVSDRLVTASYGSIGRYFFKWNYLIAEIGDGWNQSKGIKITISLD